MADGVPQNPSWEREELILACDLVAQNQWRQIAATDPRVTELSELLRRLPLHDQQLRRPNFRNANGVARKTADLATNRPGYGGTPTRGGELDKRVIEDFLRDEGAMHKLALAIRQAEASGEFAVVAAADDDGTAEGRLLTRRHIHRERSAGLRRRKLAAIRRSGRPLACEVCDFDFEQTYGDRGRGYIECHHIVPLHVGGLVVTRLGDLALICANCHRMIHARSPWLSPGELRVIIEEARGSPLTLRASSEVVTVKQMKANAELQAADVL
jgi:5-methylcytosine-specific restriction protein A